MESVLSDKITLKNARVTYQFVDYLIASWKDTYLRVMVEKSRRHVFVQVFLFCSRLGHDDILLILS